MSRQSIRRAGKILLPVNVLILAAIAVCWHYPVFRLQAIEVDYADDRAITEDIYEQVCRAVVVSPDSNLFSIEKEKVAEELIQDEEIAEVDIRLVLPDRLEVRLHPAQPILWLAEKNLLPVAADGRPVQNVEDFHEDGYPIGGDNGGCDVTVKRWRLVEFYRELVEHDARWADVISQIVCDSVTGWQVILNGGAERILLGLNPDTRTFTRVVQFLETVPEARWKHGTIDARFDGSIILTPCDDKSRRAHTSNQEIGQANARLAYGGRS